MLDLCRVMHGYHIVEHRPNVRGTIEQFTWQFNITFMSQLQSSAKLGSKPHRLLLI